jgi:hypothetical protein
MTVFNTRLVLSSIEVYDPVADDTVLIAQNFSLTPIPVFNSFGNTALIDYESFTAGDMVFESNNLSNTCTVIFPATVDLLDLFERAIIDNYQVFLGNYRTPPNASPMIYNPFGSFGGDVFSMDTDLVSLTLTLARRATSTEADFPWRRYSSNIISPVLAG